MKVKPFTVFTATAVISLTQAAPISIGHITTGTVSAPENSSDSRATTLYQDLVRRAFGLQLADAKSIVEDFTSDPSPLSAKDPVYYPKFPFSGNFDRAPGRHNLLSSEDPMYYNSVGRVPPTFNRTPGPLSSRSSRSSEQRLERDLAQHQLDLAKNLAQHQLGLAKLRNGMDALRNHVIGAAPTFGYTVFKQRDGSLNLIYQSIRRDHTHGSLKQAVPK